MSSNTTVALGYNQQMAYFILYKEKRLLLFNFYYM